MRKWARGASLWLGAISGFAAIGYVWAGPLYVEVIVSSLCCCRDVTELTYKRVPTKLQDLAYFYCTKPNAANLGFRAQKEGIRYDRETVIFVGLGTLVHPDVCLYIIVRDKQIWPRSVVLVL